MEALKIKDHYTYYHCIRVSKLAKKMAQELGLSEKDQIIIEGAALFHDLGKIGVPNEILCKPSKLTPKEFEIMKKHPEFSVEILKPLSNEPYIEMMLPGILHHHERIDGKGYPVGLSNENIPLSSRVILVVDAFDAMTTSRPYREKLSTQTAYKELNLFAGSQFDNYITQLFLQKHPTWGDLDQYEVDRSIKKAA